MLQSVGVTESDTTERLNNKQRPSTGGAAHLPGSQACVSGGGGGGGWCG